MKRKETRAIVVHCSATRPDQDIGVAEIREWHLAKGWADVGYAFVVRRNGLIEVGRDMEAVGAHVAGRNADTIGICLVGGLDAQGRPVVRAQYTEAQLESARVLINFLQRVYPSAVVVGHRELSPDRDGDGKIQPWEWVKTCPGISMGDLLS